MPLDNCILKITMSKVIPKYTDFYIWIVMEDVFKLQQIMIYYSRIQYLLHVEKK
jgi:hypothetical protein